MLLTIICLIILATFSFNLSHKIDFENTDTNKEAKKISFRPTIKSYILGTGGIVTMMVALYLLSISEVLELYEFVSLFIIHYLLFFVFIGKSKSK